jgi:serine/threonine-protein kinase
LESALAGNLPAEDETSLNRHLESCEACSAALEQLAGGEAWRREAASLLATDELDAAVPTRDEWSDIDFTVEHLEPSDEPNVLGRLGGYDVHQIIGRGGMGIVLKGFDRELKRPVAIKVLSPHLAQSPLAKKRFAREAQAAAAVVHPHVMPIHQVHVGGRLPFLVMPLVTGESLAERLAAQGSLELKETLRIGMQAAAGLAAAHEQGLVHRDVKPANILLEKGVERAVLTDFGLARAADDVTLTRWGIVAGTPQYMSPEQARGEPLDARSDLFSLGCVLYEMATGVSPFRTESVMATMRRLVDDAPQAMHALNPEFPPWFIAIVDRLLEKDPARRFNSAAEVSQLLENCLAHLQQPAVVPLHASLAPYACRNFKFSRKGVLLMLSALAAALLGIMLWQSSNPPNIAGKWTGAEWDEVVLKQTEAGEYEGTYTDTYQGRPGTIQLKWSRTERRFKGTWEEGKLRYGKIALRLVGDEIRGAWATDEKSTINPGTPELADLMWTRTSERADSPGSKGTRIDGDRISDIAEPFQIFDPNSPAIRHSLNIGTVSAVHPKNGEIEVSLQEPGSTKLGDVLEVSRPEDRPDGETKYRRFGRMRLIDIRPNGNPIARLTHSTRQRVKNRWEWMAPALGDHVTRPVTNNAADSAEREQQAGRPSSTATKLEGDWQLDNITGGGVQGWEQNLKVRVRGNKWTIIRPSGETPHRLVLGADGNEQAIDLIQDQGSKPPIIYRGLYHLHDDTLTIAWGDPPSKRPTGFEGIEAGVHTWKRIKADTSVSAPTTQASASNATGEDKPRAVDLRFSETKDVFLSMDSMKYMLDLDTGEVMDPPARPRPEQERMDVHPTQWQPSQLPTGLTGMSLQGYEVSERSWDASPSEVREGLAREGRQPLKQMDYVPQEPFPRNSATFFFKTRAGTEGILQLVGLDQVPKGIFIRYKTLVSGPPNTAPQLKTSAAMPKFVHHFQTDDKVNKIAISPDGKRIAIANGNPTFILQTSGTSRLKDNWKPSAQVLDGNSGKPIVSLKLSTPEEDAVLAATERVFHFEVTALAFSPDASLLAIGTSIGQVKLFNSQTGELVRSLDDEKSRLADKDTPENWKPLNRAMGSVKSLALSPDGLLAVCGSSFAEFSDVFDGIESLGRAGSGRGRLKIWDAKTGALKHDLAEHSQVFAVAFSWDGNMLASTGRWSGPDHGNGVLVWNPHSGEKLRTIVDEANGGTHSVTLSPNKVLMAYGSVRFNKENDTSNTAISVAFPASGITEWKKTVPGWAIPAFSPDGRSIVALCGRQSIRIIDTETGALKHELKANDHSPGGRWNDFAIASKANLVAVGGADTDKGGSITIWALGEPEKIE